MKDYRYDVVAAGHICLDISPAIGCKKHYRVEDLFVPGKIVNLDGVTVSGGGPVASTGFALKKIGLRVKPIANVGDDFFGKALNDIVYKQCGETISFNHNITTSYSIVLAIPGLDRVILHDPAGNNTFSSQNIDYGSVQEAKIFHFGYPPLMRRIYEKNGEELKSIYKNAKAAGAATSMDMALPDPDSDAGKADWQIILENTLPFVDIFLPSIEELLYMLDKTEYKRIKDNGSSADFIEKLDLSVLPALGQKIIDMGSKIAVIKCGSKGIYIKTAAKEQFHFETLELDKEKWANKEIFEESYYVTNFVSALGAGDTTIAGFLAAMVKGLDIYEAAKLACKTGALCCQAYDSVSGLQSLGLIIEKVKNEPRKNRLLSAPDAFIYNNDKSTWEHKTTII